MDKRHIVVAVSDLHCGSSVGLAGPKGIPLDDGQVILPSKIQRWLWERWEMFWGTVMVARQNAHLTIILNGDLVDGPEHHGTTQVMARHPGTQFKILCDVMAPVLATDPGAVVVVRGTEAHTGKSGSVEEAFAEWLAGEGINVPAHESRHTRSWWRFTGDFGPCRIDAAHHGRMGNRPWTKGGQVANYAAQIFYEYASSKRRHPDIAIRSHYHKVVDTYDMHPVRVIQLPAWQVATAFIHRIAPDAIADIGGVIIEVTDSAKPRVDKLLYPPTEGVVWQAPM